MAWYKNYKHRMLLEYPNTHEEWAMMFAIDLWYVAGEMQPDFSDIAVCGGGGGDPEVDDPENPKYNPDHEDLTEEEREVNPLPFGRYHVQTGVSCKIDVYKGGTTFGGGSMDPYDPLYWKETFYIYIYWGLGEEAVPEDPPPPDPVYPPEPDPVYPPDPEDPPVPEEPDPEELDPDNPEDTYCFYDFHNDNIVDPAKWVFSGVTEDSNEVTEESNDYMVFTTTPVGKNEPWVECWAKSLQEFSVGSDLTVRIKLDEKDMIYNTTSIGMSNWDTDNFFSLVFGGAYHSGDPNDETDFWIGGGGEDGRFTVTDDIVWRAVAGTWYTFRFRWLEDKITIYVDDIVILEYTDTKYFPEPGCTMGVDICSVFCGYAPLPHPSDYTTLVDFTAINCRLNGYDDPDPTDPTPDPIDPPEDKPADVLTWAWTFGDGGTSTEQNPVHSYASSGTFSVTLTATLGDQEDSETKEISITDVDNTNCVDLEIYRTEILTEADALEKVEKFPVILLNDWIHVDIIQTVMEFIKSLHWRYLQKSIVHLQSNVGYSQTNVSHASGGTGVTGFTGLTVDDFKDGAIIYSNGTSFYLSRIASNTEDTVVLSDGTSLPVISSGTIFLSKNDTNGLSADLKGIDFLEVHEPILTVKNLNGDGIRRIVVDHINQIDVTQPYDNNAYWYQKQNSLFIAYGLTGKLSNAVEILYLRKPRRALTDTSCIDLPLEYHSYAQHLTMNRIYTKLKKIDMVVLNQKYLDNASMFLRANEKEIFDNTKKLLRA